ncbi:thermonuclease family protein [uncultured Desulfobacter sp.]|uniref:thermonuclease family protein n=1 Tax=uncultured Desulfobacter sp. TaxID=240139 RepID=UPI002AAA8BE2|nr:thermonuclease family protein [uncultured Desulfobacter sp.]
MRPVIHILVIVFWVLSASQAICDVYSWTDENGIRHFSNVSSPYGKKATQIPESVSSVIDKSNFLVTKVFDGDTVQVQGRELEFRIRMVAIDAPETGGSKKNGQPYSQRAKEALTQLIQGKKVRLKQYGTGGYNRVLAEIFSQDVNINLVMVRRGLAEVYRGRLPESLDFGSYEKAEAAARRRRAGMWSLGKAYKSPKTWRKENPR